MPRRDLQSGPFFSAPPSPRCSGTVPHIAAGRAYRLDIAPNRRSYVFNTAAPLFNSFAYGRFGLHDTVLTGADNHPLVTHRKSTRSGRSTVAGLITSPLDSDPRSLD